jgi:hypothetical protein
MQIVLIFPCFCTFVILHFCFAGVVKFHQQHCDYFRQARAGACATGAQEQGPLPPMGLKIIVSDSLINTNFSND